MIMEEKDLIKEDNELGFEKIIIKHKKNINKYIRSLYNTTLPRNLVIVCKKKN